MPADAWSEKRSDARQQDAGINCECIVGDYCVFESLFTLAGRIDATGIRRL